MIQIALRYRIWGLFLGLITLTCLGVWAQRPRGSSATVLEQLIQEAEVAYSNGQLTKAQDLLERYTKSLGGKTQLPEADLLSRRIGQMARLSEHRDTLELLDSLIVPMPDLALSLERMLLDKHGYNHVGSFRLELRSDSLWYFGFTPPLRRMRLESLSGQGRDSATRLDRIGGKFLPRNESFSGLGEHIAMPILLSDGIRIVFAQKLDGGLGGYDLYFSRMNTDTGQYLRPTLMGLPYNSPSNDYLLVYDEVGERTLLVSDRSAPKGQVIIYRYRGCPSIFGGVSPQ